VAGIGQAFSHQSCRQLAQFPLSGQAWREAAGACARVAGVSLELGVQADEDLPLRPARGLVRDRYLLRKITPTRSLPFGLDEDRALESHSPQI